MSILTLKSGHLLFSGLIDKPMSAQVKYIRSAVLPKDYPNTDRPEIALAGRSNAGKSSFLNAIANAKVAHVSQAPGKTRLLNFFDFGKHYRIVDMPGYGYASRSGDEIVQWTEMVETYVTTRETLAGMVLLMDIRRKWSAEEEMLKKFTETSGIPMAVLLTKIDKCTKAEVNKFAAGIRKSSALTNVFPISSTTKVGVDAVEDFIYEAWIKEGLQS